MRLFFQRFNGIEWVTEDIGGDVSISNHASLTNLTWKDSKHTGEADKYAGFDSDGNAISLEGGGGGETIPIGSIMPYPMASAPTGYEVCDGGLLSRTTFSDLFNVIGTDYGVGDGSTTFNKPDYRGVFLRGSGEHATMVKAGGTPFDGGSVGDENEDMMFGHAHHSGYSKGYVAHVGRYGMATGLSSQTDGDTNGSVTANDPFQAAITSPPQTDGVNGTPNAGNETVPANIAVTWIIRATNTSVTLEEVSSDTIADLIVTNSATFQGSCEAEEGITVPVLHVQDQKASGTIGGTFTAGAWRTRTLNTELTNTIDGASLIPNQITLPAGTYKINASAEAYDIGRHKIVLWNFTDSTYEVIGTSSFGADSNNGSNRSFLFGIFTITSPKIFKLQHRCEVSQSFHGFGVAGSFGVVEVYADVFIEKLG